ncbi:hypothetical protein [Klebsiella pneumoniae]|uniref:hypothetical protein n=1 Tax=Klebsiella pneumoniae TaxID=573 RepID=UPI00396F40CC
MLHLGIDIGGTKMEAVLLDPAGECVQRLRRPTHKESYDAFMRQLLTLIADIRAVSPQPFTRDRPAGLSIRKADALKLQLHGAQRSRSAPGYHAAAASRCGWQTMPTASPFRRRWMAPAPELPPSSG